jgi:hypothetical protein
MKRIVAVAITSTLILLAMVGVASADEAKVKVDKIMVNGTNPLNTTVSYDSTVFFYVVFDVTSGDLGNIVSDFKTNLTITANSRSKTYPPYPSQMRNIVSNVTYTVPQPPGTKIETGKYEVRFGHIKFYDHFGITVAGIEEVEYDIPFEYRRGVNPVKDSEPGHGPSVGPPEPIIITRIPLKKDLYYLEDLEIEFIVKDVMADKYNARSILKAYKPPHYSEIEFEEIAERKHIGGNMYRYIWKIEPEDHKFTITQAINKTTFKLCVDYDSYYDYQNWCCGGLRVTEYIPKIVAYLGTYSKEEERQKLSEYDCNKIYIERKDLDRDFRFNATIEDKIEKGTAILEVCGVNDSVGCKKYTLAGPSEGIMHQYSNDSIRFDEGDSSLRIYYNRSKLPPWWPCPAKPWKVYNITIIPFEIAFENATVYQEEGNWSDEFNFSVLVTASKDLTIALKVFDPCLETWSGPMDRTYFNTSGWKQLNWTVNGATFFSEKCSGESKFYFEYEGKETQVYQGPDLGGNGSELEFNNGITNPEVTIYCNWSQSSTPCNYSVNVNSEDEHKVRLLVKDPTGKLMPRDDVKDISSKTKELTWTTITPFKSLNLDHITQDINDGTRADFTFEYDEHKKANKNFSGPLLVAAFKEPKLVPKDICWNDTFNYSVTVIGSEKLLNITLKYLSDGKWTSEDITEPTKEYNNNNNNTERKLLTWTCKAIKLWEDVKFDVNVTGEGKPIEVY